MARSLLPDDCSEHRVWLSSDTFRIDFGFESVGEVPEDLLKIERIADRSSIEDASSNDGV